MHARPPSRALDQAVQAAQPSSSTQATKRVHRHAHGVATGSQKPAPADAGYGTGHRHHHPHHTAAARHTHSGLDHSHSASSCPICLDLAALQVLKRPVRWGYRHVDGEDMPGTSNTVRWRHRGPGCPQSRPSRPSSWRSPLCRTSRSRASADRGTGIIAV